MSLKELQIESFKSFADKTSISFPDRVTAIVGPNGCGKSNITDAIKWVLGDTKPTSLRSSNKSSLIFNGTDSRAPHNSCEVVLRLDNQKRFVPLEEDEIIIRKRITKLGVTETFVNDRPCKLTELQELFRDTGLGKDGYSMVSQGQIYEIIKSSPKNRRSIFEEAVGIATYKKKKQAAEQKLEKTDINIEKTEWICNEIQKTIDPLEKDAQIAKEARQLVESQKTEEVNQYIYQKENENLIIGEFKNDIEKLENEINLLNQEIIQKKELYDENLIKIKKIEFEIETLQKDERELYIKQEQARGQNNLLNEKLTNAQKEYSQAERIYKEEKENIERKLDKEQQEEYKKSKFESDIVLLEKKIEELEKNIKLSQEEIESLENQAGISQDETINNIAILAEIKQNKAKFETELKLLIESISTKQIEIETLKENKKILEKEQVKLKEDITVNEKNIEKVVFLKSELKDTIKNLEEEYENVKDIMYKNKVKLSASQQELQTLKAYKEEYSGCNNTIKRLMQFAKEEKEIEDKIEGLVLELLKVPKELEMAINVTLGARAQNVVVRTPNDAAQLIDFLKKRQIGVVTFLPITTYKQYELDPIFKECVNMKGVIGVASDLVKFEKRYENIYKGLLGRTVVVDNLETAKQLSNKYRQSFRIVTLEGDIIETTGAISGGFRSRDNSINLFETDRKINELEKDIRVLTASIEKEEKKIEEIKENLEISKQEFQGVEGDVSQREIKIAQSRERFEANKTQVISFTEKISISEQDLNLSINRRDSIREGLKKIQEGDKDIHEIKVSDKTKEINLRLSSLRNQNEKDKIELSSSKVEYQKNISDREACIKLLESIKEEIIKSNNLVDESQKTMNDLQVVIEKNKKELEETIMTQQQRDELESIKNKINEAKTRRENVENESLQILEEKENYTNKINSKQIKINTLSMNLEKVFQEMKDLETYIIEQYNINYEQALVYKQDNFEYENSKDRIQSIKRKISKLGEINYASIEAYDREKNKLDRLLEQLDDLKIAKNKLETLILDLSTSMLKKFNRDFEKINKNFQEVFKELFDGGRANLILQDVELGEDELERGIDIEAEPPGKKITNINALSGGEQTLTAIAILFAIIKVKVVPFCVLDEIDAALDDSNVHLFAQYLKRFKKETQFIIITHRRPTMELADKLNGVTMEERGVSKIARCSLEKAVDLLKDEEINND